MIFFLRCGDFLCGDFFASHSARTRTPLPATALPATPLPATPLVRAALLRCRPPCVFRVRARLRMVWEGRTCAPRGAVFFTCVDFRHPLPLRQGAQMQGTERTVSFHPNTEDHQRFPTPVTPFYDPGLTPIRHIPVVKFWYFKYQCLGNAVCLWYRAAARERTERCRWMGARLRSANELKQQDAHDAAASSAGDESPRILGWNRLRFVDSSEVMYRDAAVPTLASRGYADMVEDARSRGVNREK